MGKHSSPLPRKHVCIPSMLPCVRLPGNLSTSLLAHHPYMPRSPAPCSRAANDLRWCFLFFLFFRNWHFMCRLLWVVLILQKAVKGTAGFAWSCPRHQAQIACARTGEQSRGVLETQWCAAGQTLIACSQKNKQRRTQSFVFDQQPRHRWCPPSQFFPHYLARLGFVLPGCALLLY